MSDSESEDLPQGGNIDPYELLGIDREATADQVKSAYRKQALRTHPGTNLSFTISRPKANMMHPQTRYPVRMQRKRRPRRNSSRSHSPTQFCRTRRGGSATMPRAIPPRPSAAPTSPGPSSTPSSSATPSPRTPSRSSPPSTRARTRKRRTSSPPTSSSKATWTRSTRWSC